MIQPDAEPEDIESEIEYMHATASPAAHRFIWCCLMGFDIRPMLRHVTQQTLVVHAKNDQLYPVKHGRYLAEYMPGASYIELESNCHVPMFDPNVLSQLQVRYREIYRWTSFSTTRGNFSTSCFNGFVY